MAALITIGDEGTTLLDGAIALPEVRGRLRDKFGRAITDLRVSVTDRCNYKCVYCRTGNEGAQFSELPIADYLRMIRSLVALGIEELRPPPASPRWSRRSPRCVLPTFPTAPQPTAARPSISRSPRTATSSKALPLPS